MKHLTGKQFDRLTAQWPVGRKSYSGQTKIVWLCSCVCGRLCLRTTGQLEHAKGFKSCGCDKSQKFKYIDGQKFGRLTAVWPAGLTGAGVVWFCVCECGGTTNTLVSRLCSGTTQSCGCLRGEALRGKPRPEAVGNSYAVRHGACRKGLSPEYHSYTAAKQRCTNPKTENYQLYGGRGIQFRFASFEEFFAELGPRPAGTSIDRIDPNGHYEKGNVHWDTYKNQRRNQRTHKRSCLS